jgi:hypothetical protein
VKKVFLATAAYGNTHWESITSIQHAISYAKARGIEVVRHLVRGGGSASTARAVSIHHFLKTDCTHYMHIGCDVVIPPIAIHRLTTADKDVSGGVYPKRSMELIPAVVLEEHDSWREVIKNMELAPALFVSGDFFCFKRKVVETLCTPDLAFVYPDCDAPIYGLFMPMFAETTNGRIYLEEDWAMCHRARLAGFEIWADCAIQCKHNTQFFRGFEELYVNESKRVGNESEGLCGGGHDNGGQLHPSAAERRPVESVQHELPLESVRRVSNVLDGARTSVR